MNIKKNDTVFIISGKDRGKTGLVQKVLYKNNKIVVTGVGICKKHLKPSKKSPHGGIVDINSPINATNAMIFCPHCSKPIKPKVKLVNDIKERICRKCNGNLDQQKEDNGK